MKTNKETMKVIAEGTEQAETCCMIDNIAEKAAESINRQLQDKYRVRDEPPPRGKDYNEYLVRLYRS